MYNYATSINEEKQEELSQTIMEILTKRKIIIVSSRWSF